MNPNVNINGRILYAKKRGASDEQIVNALAETQEELTPRIEQARAQGATNEQILAAIQETQRASAPAELGRGIGGGVLGLAEGAVELAEGLGGLAATGIRAAQSGTVSLLDFMRGILGAGPSEEELKKREESGAFARSSGDVFKLPGQAGKFALDQLKGVEVNGVKVGEVFSPTTEAQEDFREFTKDFAQFAFGGAAGPALKLAVGTNVGAKLLENTGLITRDQKDTAKAVLSLGALTFQGVKSARNTGAAMLDDADKLIREGEKVSATKLQAKIAQMNKAVKRGIGDPGTEEFAKRSQRLLDLIDEKGMIEVQHLTQTNRNINALNIDETTKGAKKLLLGMQKEVRSTIAEYGKKNPEFLNLWRDGNIIFGTASNVDGITRWARKLTGTDNLGIKLIAGMAGGPKAIVGAGLARGAAEAQFLVRKVMANPQMRKFYMESIAAGIAQNEQAFRKTTLALEKLLRKDPETAKLLTQ